MKQSINSGMFIAIIAAVVVVAAAIIVWVYRAPPAAVAQASNPDSALSSGGGGASGKSRGASIAAEMREAHSGPTPEQRKQIEEWKRAHPDGYTRQ